VYATNSTTRASDAIPMHKLDGTIEGNGGKYRSHVSKGFPLPLTITSVSPTISPQVTKVSTYALHDANLIDDEENKNIKFDDLFVHEGNMNMDVDGIFH